VTTQELLLLLFTYYMNRTLTAVLSFIGAISTVILTVAHPHGRNTAVISRTTAKLRCRRTVGYTCLVIVRQLEEIRTCTRELAESRCQQTQVRASSIVRSTWVCNYNITDMHLPADAENSTMQMLPLTASYKYKTITRLICR